MNQLQIIECIAHIPEFSGADSKDRAIELNRFLSIADNIYETLSKSEKQLFGKLIKLRLTEEAFTRIYHKEISDYPTLRKTLNEIYLPVYSLTELERKFLETKQNYEETTRNYGYRLYDALDQFKASFKNKYGYIDQIYNKHLELQAVETFKRGLSNTLIKDKIITSKAESITEIISETEEIENMVVSIMNLPRAQINKTTSFALPTIDGQQVHPKSHQIICNYCEKFNHTWDTCRTRMKRDRLIQIYQHTYTSNVSQYCTEADLEMQQHLNKNINNFRNSAISKQEQGTISHETRNYNQQRHSNFQFNKFQTNANFNSYFAAQQQNYTYEPESYTYKFKQSQLDIPETSSKLPINKKPNIDQQIHNTNQTPILVIKKLIQDTPQGINETNQFKHLYNINKNQTKADVHSTNITRKETSPDTLPQIQQKPINHSVVNQTNNHTSPDAPAFNLVNKQAYADILTDSTQIKSPQQNRDKEQKKIQTGTKLVPNNDFKQTQTQRNGITQIKTEEHSSNQVKKPTNPFTQSSTKSNQIFQVSHENQANQDAQSTNVVYKQIRPNNGQPRSVKSIQIKQSSNQNIIKTSPDAPLTNLVIKQITPNLQSAKIIITSKKHDKTNQPLGLRILQIQNKIAANILERNQQTGHNAHASQQNKSNPEIHQNTMTAEPQQLIIKQITSSDAQEVEQKTTKIDDQQLPTIHQISLDALRKINVKQRNFNCNNIKGSCIQRKMLKRGIG